MPTAKRVSRGSEARNKPPNETTDYAVYAAFLIAITLIGGIYLARLALDNQLPPDGEPYLQARIARTFFTKGIIDNDHLVVGGAALQFTPYQAAVAMISYIFGPIGAAITTPIIFSLLSLLFLDRLLKQLGRSQMERIIALSILASSPTFLNDTIINGQQTAILAFTTASAAMILHSKASIKAGGIIAAGLASIFSPAAALITIIINIILMLDKKISWRWISALVLVSILGAGIPSIGAEAINLNKDAGLSGTIADLGAIDGIPIFTILLLATGLWILWPRKLACAATAALMAATFYNHGIISQTNAIAASLAGAAITHLINRKWNITTLKQLSLLVITCGLLFSTISTAAQISRLGPSNDIADSLAWLKGHSRSGEAVLSSPKNGNWIQYFAIRPTTADERLPPDDNRTVQAKEALQTFNIKKAEDYLKSTNTTYIYITPDMLNGTVWRAPKEGMHYLLSRHETFKNVYDSDGIEIYEYMGIYG